MAAKARIRKPPNSLCRSAGWVWCERETKGHDRPRSARIGMAREALMEVEGALPRRREVRNRAHIGRRVDCSFLRRGSGRHSLFLGNPT
jgi:hypothetical protein